MVYILLVQPVAMVVVSFRARIKERRVPLLWTISTAPRVLAVAVGLRVHLHQQKIPRLPAESVRRKPINMATPARGLAGVHPIAMCVLYLHPPVEVDVKSKRIALVHVLGLV